MQRPAEQAAPLDAPQQSAVTEHWPWSGTHALGGGWQVVAPLGSAGSGAQVPLQQSPPEAQLWPRLRLTSDACPPSVAVNCWVCCGCASTTLRVQRLGSTTSAAFWAGIPRDGSVSEPWEGESALVEVPLWAQPAARSIAANNTGGWVWGMMHPLCKRSITRGAPARVRWGRRDGINALRSGIFSVADVPQPRRVPRGGAGYAASWVFAL